MMVDPLRPRLCRECKPQQDCQVNAVNGRANLGYLQLQIGPKRTKALVDTGASTSVMSKDVVEEIQKEQKGRIRVNWDTQKGSMRVANGQQIDILGQAEVTFNIFDRTFNETFNILPHTHITILGWPFFADNDFTIDCKRRLLISEDNTMQINAMERITEEEKQETRLLLNTMQATTIGPGKSASIYCRIDNKAHQHAGHTGVVEQSEFQRGSNAEDKYAIAHSLVTLDKYGGCNVTVINLTLQARRFPKDLPLAQFSILTNQDYTDIREVHPIAAEYFLHAAKHITLSKKDFYKLTDMGKPNRAKEEANNLEELDENVTRATKTYNEQLKPPDTEDTDIVQMRELEGPTNEVWFATPENTKDPSTLDHFNKRVYDLILECKELEKLDPTKSQDMREKFLSLFNWEGTLFNKEQQAEINELLVKYHGIFARHRFDIGGNDDFKVKLTPSHDDPVYKKSPPTPLHIKEDLKVELAMLQYYGILRTLPYSKYSSPIFAQRKPNGRLRLLVDLRRINHILRHDYTDYNFPIPNMEEANNHMANKKYFSKLDCSQAYHAVKMADERSVQLLAFNFESRTFAYQRLAQGLNRSATAFSSFIRKFLEADIAADRCGSFMDDVCSATKTFAEHVTALDHVFASLQRSGLRLTVKKCEFGVPEIKYLGWTISRTGQGVQKDKIEKQLATMKMPRTPKQIQKMAGFFNYYKNYIPRLAEKLLPFYKMLQKGTKMEVTPQMKEMYAVLKEDLKKTMLRTMRLPIAGKQFVIMADASDFAAGFVLMIEDYTLEQKGKKKKLYAPVASVVRNLMRHSTSIQSIQRNFWPYTTLSKISRTSFGA